MNSHSWPKFTTEEYLVTGHFKTPGDRTATFSIPPLIADLVLPPDFGEVGELIQEATHLMTRSGKPAGMGGIMEGLQLRAEAINSSRIMGNMTSPRNLALAEAGAKSRPGAEETVRNIRALRAILNSPQTEISVDTLQRDHSIILEGKAFAGQLRQLDEHVFIGGDNIFNAQYVPPLPARISHLMQDWDNFANRPDVPIIAHLAISHLQLECIHPFRDGNGRVGRAAIQRQLLGAGYRPLPLSVAFFAMRQQYYDAFTAYQAGNWEEPIRVHALATWAAAKGLQDSTTARQSILDRWHGQAQTYAKQLPSTGKVLGWIFQNPAFTATDLAAGIQESSAVAHAIIEQLAELAIISTTKSTHKPEARHPQKIWEAREVFGLVEQLESSIASYVLK